MDRFLGRTVRKRLTPKLHLLFWSVVLSSVSPSLQVKHLGNVFGLRVLVAPLGHLKICIGLASPCLQLILIKFIHVG